MPAESEPPLVLADARRWQTGPTAEIARARLAKTLVKIRPWKEAMGQMADAHSSPHRLGSIVTVKNSPQTLDKTIGYAIRCRRLLDSDSKSRGTASTCGNACSEAIDLDRSRKLAIVEASTVLDRCRLMVNAALGDPSQNDGKDDGKTHASRGEHQVKQRLTEAVDDRVGVGERSRTVAVHRDRSQSPGSV